MPDTDTSLFRSSFFERKKTLEKLIEESRTDFDFYLFLSISAFITTLGLVLDNAIVVIGGMMVAPLLFPILSLAMGLTTSNGISITRSLSNIVKAVFSVIAVSLITAFLFQNSHVISDDALLYKITYNLEFFLVAFAAGTAAAYSWAKQGLSATLPGIAVSVALIPPLSAVSIGVILVETSVVASAATLFVINILGIAVSALVIFSLFGFSSLRREEEKLIHEEQVENLENKEEELEKTKEELEEVKGQIKQTKEEKEEDVQAEGEKNTLA